MRALAAATAARGGSLSLLATGQDDDTAANGDGDGDGDGLPDVAAAIAASAGAWAQQLALAALDELSSELMPPVALVSLLPPPPQQKVASVLLSAPLVGYGVSTDDDSVTARAVPSDGGSSLPASSCASFGCAASRPAWRARPCIRPQSSTYRQTPMDTVLMCGRLAAFCTRW